MSILTVVIPGAPVGKGRPKFTSVGGFGRAYTPAKTARWERRAADILRSEWKKAGYPQIVDQPVKVEILAFASRPKRLLRKSDPESAILRIGKPDIDNVTKAVLDAIQGAGIVNDDKIVSRVEAVSLYAAKGQEPHVAVRVSTFLDAVLPEWYTSLVTANRSPT